MIVNAWPLLVAEVEWNGQALTGVATATGLGVTAELCRNTTLRDALRLQGPKRPETYWNIAIFDAEAMRMQYTPTPVVEVIVTGSLTKARRDAELLMHLYAAAMAAEKGGE